jgi:UDP-N-acetylglucosamine--N-acetylmuramyl-(pentapeptide) pyrophosphoryl-undecaprenol N-acetylglucosamine transferase
VTDAGTLAEVLVEILSHPARLAAMAEAARGVGVPDAVERLADLVERQGRLPAPHGAAATTDTAARRTAA